MSLRHPPRAARELPGTKFVRPRVPDAYVTRERLSGALDLGTQRSVTLLAAPAGAGKTALVSHWVSTRADLRTAWLSLDPLDRDRRRFWRAFLEALRRAGVPEPVSALAVGPSADVDHLVPALINALEAVDEPVVLVLDDLHEIGDSPAITDLESLLRHPAAGLRLVVATRADPPLRLGRIRVSGGLTEIRAAELAFTLDETLAIVRASDVSVSAETAELLWERTEGWAAGVRLAALAMHRHPDPEQFVAHFAGDDTAIAEYLLEEVLSRERPDVLEFLLKIAPAGEVNAALADALTGRTDSSRVLARLARDHVLLAATGEPGGWYRLHPLFAEMLRAQLRFRDRSMLSRQHARAAAWLGASGRPIEALRHASAAQAWEHAAVLIGEHWLSLLVDGELESLRPTLEAMPDDVLEARPDLGLAMAGLHANSGEVPSAGAWLETARARREDVPPERLERYDEAAAAVALILGRLQGDLDAAVANARHVFARAGGQRSPAAPDMVRALVLTELGIAEFWNGDLAQARLDLENARVAALADDRDWLVIVTSAYLSLLAALDVRYARADRLAREAEELARRRGWEETWPIAVTATTLSIMAYNRGQIAEAVRQHGRIGPRLNNSRDRPLRAVDALQRARVLAAQGRGDATLDAVREARHWLGEWPIMPAITGLIDGLEATTLAATGEVERGRSVLRSAADTEEAAVARASLHLHAKEPDRAIETLRSFLDQTSTLRCTQTESWVVTALAYAALENQSAAQAAVERALDLAESGGLQQPFLVHGHAVVGILREHLRSGTSHGALAGAILRSLDGRGDVRTVPTLADPLSLRELAVLRYLPTMMSNREIASELFVSVNTVKTHLKAIYRKLAVEDRRDAVRRARDIGLLGPGSLVS